MFFSRAPAKIKIIIDQMLAKPLKTDVREVMKVLVKNAEKRLMVSDDREFGDASQKIVALRNSPLDGHTFQLDSSLTRLGRSKSTGRTKYETSTIVRLSLYKGKTNTKKLRRIG